MQSKPTCLLYDLIACQLASAMQDSLWPWISLDSAHVSLSIWDGYPTSSTLPSFSHPTLNHPYKAGSNDFRPFLATQVLNELLLLRIFIVLVHPIWPSRTVYWNTWCPLVAAVWIWTGLCVQGLGLWGKKLFPHHVLHCTQCKLGKYYVSHWLLVKA